MQVQNQVAERGKEHEMLMTVEMVGLQSGLANAINLGCKFAADFMAGQGGAHQSGP